ncbi:hypothetical protein R1flu_022365 [Riccia fluitans]|uniref:Uncharacterized protein n=1 Tax=Riccia fluitans TaxID=41844 RepID=A0ABD1ZSG3_9MARC
MEGEEGITEAKGGVMKVEARNMEAKEGVTKVDGGVEVDLEEATEAEGGVTEPHLEEAADREGGVTEVEEVAREMDGMFGAETFRASSQVRNVRSRTVAKEKEQQMITRTRSTASGVQAGAYDVKGEKQKPDKILDIGKLPWKRKITRGTSNYQFAIARKQDMM